VLLMDWEAIEHTRLWIEVKGQAWPKVKHKPTPKPILLFSLFGISHHLMVSVRESPGNEHFLKPSLTQSLKTFFFFQNEDTVENEKKLH
jgi:hypothetical protein